MLFRYSHLHPRARRLAASWRRGLSARQFLVLAFVIGSVLPFALRDPRPDPELTRHLRAGQSILETRSVPRTSPGRASVDHAWALEAPAFLLYRSGGQAGLALCAALAAAATALMLVVLIYHLTGRLLVALAGTGCVIAGMAPHLAPRPEVVTYLLFALLLLLLIRARADRRAARALWVTPLLFVIWANAHEGFVIGLLLLAIHWLAEEWEGAVVAGAPTPAHVRLLRLVLPASVAACFLNPYGYPLLASALAHTPVPLLPRSPSAGPPPDFAAPGHQAAMMGGLLLLTGGLGFSPGRRRPADIWLALLVTFLALTARPQLPLFLIGIVPAATVPLSRLLRETTTLLAGAPVLRDVWLAPLPQRASAWVQQIGTRRSPLYWLPLAALCGCALFGTFSPRPPADAPDAPARQQTPPR